MKIVSASNTGKLFRSDCGESVLAECELIRIHDSTLVDQ